MITEAAELLAVEDAEAQRQWLAQWAAGRGPAEHEQLAEALKVRADQLVRAELGHCFQASALIRHLAELTGNARCRALGLLAEANGQVIGLAEARRLFEQEENQVAVADADLQAALVLLAQNEAGKSLALAQACIELFQQRGLPTGQAWACLVATRAALALERLPEAQKLVDRAAVLAVRHELPALAYQSSDLRGALAARQGQRRPSRRCRPARWNSRSGWN